ncbi:hypothetical protein [Streptomyces sp. NPDC003717]|uniref:hypothetical protein n=1 Tax=Streptomyces sp. NPDC003717 TaxID=3154276 RepID=UPI0033BB5A2A
MQRRTVLLAGCALVAGCSGGGEAGIPSPATSPSASVARGVTYRRAKETLHRNQAALWDRYPDVQGMGITAVEDRPRSPSGTDEVYGIVVYLVDAGAVPAGPEEVDGVPLRFRVWGPVSALPAE